MLNCKRAAALAAFLNETHHRHFRRPRRNRLIIREGPNKDKQTILRDLFFKQSLANTKARKNLAQKVVRNKFAGNGVAR